MGMLTIIIIKVEIIKKKTIGKKGKITFLRQNIKVVCSTLEGECGERFRLKCKGGSLS